MFDSKAMKYYHERNRAIALEYFDGVKNKAKIGRKFGLSGFRVSQIIRHQERRSRAWLLRPQDSLMSHNPEGQILDPDNDVNDRDCLHEWNVYTQIGEFAAVTGEG